MYELDRSIKIFICKDGTISYSPTFKPFNGAAIPVHSTDTVDEARQLQVLLGRAQYGEHPNIPGQTWYVFCRRELVGDVDKLHEIAAIFQEAHRRMKQLVEDVGRMG